MAGNQESKDKYLKEKVETFLIRVPKGKKEEIQKFAKNNGYRSLNNFVVDLIDKRMKATNIQGNSILTGNITGDNNANMNINTSKEIIKDETESEIYSILSDLSLRDRFELLTIIYKFADKHKK